MHTKKKICIAFLGNPYHDSRVTNLYNSLVEDGYDVTVISFNWFSEEITNEKKYIVHEISRKQGSLFFYLSFILKLFFSISKTNADIYFAEDIYTLPLIVFWGKLRKAKIFYNSREIYAFIGGLRNRPILQKFITSIEKYFIQKVDLVLTTGEMDTEFLKNFYHLNNVITVRNIPLYQSPTFNFDFRKKYNIPNEKKILLYQGILIDGRGIAIVIRALQKIQNAVFILLGDGSEKVKYINLAKKLNVNDKVFFAGSISQNELINYTSSADIGLALIENISISYYHALPNKLFEYIMAKVPVISCNLPQMKNIVEKYKVGKVINLENENEVVQTIQEMINNENQLIEFKKNCEAAAKELNWQKEYKILQKEIMSII
ncbi:glycosyltransferase [Stygiobacter electus]|uniref:Glycosyltransferase n=1 Tax=Stygiobacter electus TaxID=3032292 RepID=A0AAE3P0F2_9BACT|nr:glycosyltransferase [Stygiobacter electus]MDF1612102.1 glycosyltransferase [Stygiobacter electus]